VTPVLAVARRGARDQWRSNIVLGALITATVAMAVASLTGARRAESALERLRAESHSSDLQLFLDDPDLDTALDELVRIEGIAEVGVSSELFVRPVGSDLFPDYQLLSIAPRTDLAGAALDVPRIVGGRGIRPDAADEIVVSDELAAELDIHVGDRIELESMTAAWVEVAFNGGDPGAPDGPVVEVTVVGLARTPADFDRFAGRIIHLSPAFAARFEDQIRTYTWVSARVTDPSEAGLHALASGPLAGFDSEEVSPSFFTHSEATQDGLATIAAALRLIALAGVVAGVTAIGLALARLARDTLAVRTTLVAIGWTRAQLVLLVVLRLGPWVLASIAVGLVLGALGSPIAVVGLARSVDPEAGALAPYPGWIAVVGLASIVVLLLLLGLTAVRAGRSARGSTVVGRALPQLLQPLAVPIGVRRALFGASDRGGRASRGAAVAVAASVTVAVAALMVGASIQRLQDDPSLSGQGSIDQRAIDSGESLDVYEQAMATLEADDRVIDLLGLHVAFGIRGPGNGELTALVLDVRRGDAGAAIVSGRLAVQPDEVAVGPATLEELDLAVGDVVELSSDHGSARFRIVGTTLFPEGDFRHDAGVAMTVGGADRFLGSVEDATSIHQVAFGWAQGVDEAAADRSLEDQGLQPFTTGDGLQPAVVSNLREVRDLPRLLVALVIALGLATLLHAVLVTTRRRDGEAGTLRALGVTPRTIAALVVTQATVIGVIAVAIGIPLGLGLGRQVWSPIAGRANVVPLAVAPWPGSAVVALAVLLGAAGLAVPIAFRALRQRPADALRAE
jgi:predicted lysophospholipase L1 biosynthesis ABC-type transport system permease subunit